jgi:CheY-like chemotaxis protein
MSLILAVEPDRKQAKQLSSVVRQHVKAEFVVADSGAAALAALGNRIPDLILTPALLPPKDEAVLTGWLRDLGDAAAHVQTLAIPILSEPNSGKKDKDQGSGSIFGRLREQGPADAGPGCDPGVFADQIRVYLDRVDSDRSSRVAPMPVVVPEPVKETPVVLTVADESVPEVEAFDEAVTFDDLVFDPSPEPAPAPVQVPVTDPPVTMRPPTPFARPEKRVDPAILKSWESELGLESTSGPAAPLWRASSDMSTDSPVAPARVSPVSPVSPVSSVSSDGLVFDPADARYAPVFRRLDEVAGLHA